MAIGKAKSEESNWVSFSDIMTALMVIFMFIAISYMIEANKKVEEVKVQKELMDNLVKEYKVINEDIYNDLDKEFSQDFEQWDAVLDKDLSIRFRNPQVLFSSMQAQLTPRFKTILRDFIPRYLEIINSDKYRDKIAELRIEGHTDPDPITRQAAGNQRINYVENLGLSQRRSKAVTDFVLNTEYCRRLSQSDKDWLIFHLSANGLSFSKSLDREGELSYNSKNPVYDDISRRVEFRIVTSKEVLFEEMVKLIDNDTL